MALAYASRSVILYAMLAASRLGNTNTFARPATGEPGALRVATASTAAASNWSSPSIASPGEWVRASSVAVRTRRTTGWSALPLVENDSIATDGNLAGQFGERAAGGQRDLRQLLRVRRRDDRAVGIRDDPGVWQRHEETARDGARPAARPITRTPARMTSAVGRAAPPTHASAIPVRTAAAPRYTGRRRTRAAWPRACRGSAARSRCIRRSGHPRAWHRGRVPRPRRPGEDGGRPAPA